MTILSSDILGYPRIILESTFYWRKHFRHSHWKSTPKHFLAGAVFGEDWTVTLLALHTGNDVTFLTQIADDIHFAWQVQYLLKFEVDFACSAHCK